METLEIKIRRDFLDTIYGLHILRNMISVIWPLECAVSLRLLWFWVATNCRKIQG